MLTTTFECDILCIQQHPNKKYTGIRWADEIEVRIQ